MRSYANLQSGIAAYEEGPDYIIVVFKIGGPYRYSYNSAGRHNVEAMKRLARAGIGLNTYINRYTRDLYD